MVLEIFKGKKHHSGSYHTLFLREKRTSAF